MTEKKSTVPISSLPQSRIAAMKNVLAVDASAPTDHPHTLSLYLLVWSVGAAGRTPRANADCA